MMEYRCAILKYWPNTRAVKVNDTICKFSGTITHTLWGWGRGRGKSIKRQLMRLVSTG